MMHLTRKHVSAEVSGAAEETLEASTRALETTREFASQAIDRAGEKVRHLREGLKEAGAGAQWQLGHYAKQTSRYVSERPVTSALIAAGVGAAVVVLGMAILRNNRRQSCVARVGAGQ